MDKRDVNGWSQWFSKKESSVSNLIRQQENKILQSNPTLLKKQQTAQQHDVSS